MNAQARYADAHWQIEHRLADLVGERLVLLAEIKQRENRLNEIDADMLNLQGELVHYVGDIS